MQLLDYLSKIERLVLEDVANSDSCKATAETAPRTNSLELHHEPQQQGGTQSDDVVADHEHLADPRTHLQSLVHLASHDLKTVEAIEHKVGYKRGLHVLLHNQILTVVGKYLF
mgnify:FL=1